MSGNWDNDNERGLSASGFYPAAPINQNDPFNNNNPHNNKQSVSVPVVFVPKRTSHMPDKRFDCKPQYCYSPWAILRWLQFVMGMSVLFLTFMTCDSYRCVVYINEFGRVAQGLGYNVFAGFFVVLLTLLMIITYSLNLHRVAPALVTVMERIVYMLSVFLLLIVAGFLTYYSAVADHPKYYDLGRADFGGIKPNWVSACVLSYINVVLYMIDLIGQCCCGYPTIRHTNV